MSLFQGIEQTEPKRSKDWTGNYHSICGCLGARNECKEEREENDYYATHPSAAEWLEKLERLAPDVWECACGEGHLARILERNGHNVKSTDLIDRGFGVGGVDFLKTSEKWHGDIVTNPPYKYALEFVKHSLEVVEDGALVCMFLKVQFLEGKNRRNLFDVCPPPNCMDKHFKDSVWQKWELQRVNGCLCVVCLGEGLQREHDASVVQLSA